MPRSGVSYSREFEWFLAARWAGYRWREFRMLDGEEQSHIVAAYRVQMQIEAVLAKESRPRRQPKKPQRKTGRRGRR